MMIARAMRVKKWNCNRQQNKMYCKTERERESEKSYVRVRDDGIYRLFFDFMRMNGFMFVLYHIH